MKDERSDPRRSHSDEYLPPSSLRRDTLGRNHPFFYGWIVVGVAFVTLFVSLGIRYSFSVFFVALTHDFGWNRAATSGIFSISLLVFALIGPLLGYWLDRFGARLIFVAGSLVLALGLALSATTQTYWQIILYYGIVASIGLGALSLGIHSVVLSRWFVRRRGLAIGLAFAGTGLGTLVFAPLVERLIANYDWRAAYLVLGAIVLALLVPANWIWARTRPSDLNLLPDGDTRARVVELKTPRAMHSARSVLRHTRFWFLIGATFFALIAVRMIVVHAVAHLVDVGFTSLFAATIFGVVGAVETVGTIGWGWLSDRVGRVWAFTLGSLSVISAIALLLILQNGAVAALAWSFALTFGLGDSSRASLVNALAGDLFEGPDYGTINGYIISAFGLGGALGPWLGGYLFDLTGHYTEAFWFAIATTFLATLGFFVAGRHAHLHLTEPQLEEI